MTAGPAGAGYSLRAAGYEAEIVQLGASVRRLTAGGRDLVMPFAADEERPAMRGALLAPWPNRLADGRYEFGGHRHRLPVDEPATRTAAHGLVALRRFEPDLVEPDRVGLRTRIEPREGYPWRVAIRVEFVLTEQGLAQEVVATNESGTPAPIGLGGHPYLLGGRPGPRAIDEWDLELPAEEVLLVSGDRMLPTVSAAVDSAGRDDDFRGGRRLGSAVLNNAYTRFAGARDGRARARLVDRNGVGTEISWDERCRWVQLYTSDHATGDDFRCALAVEPMTCPPDAFNSKRDLIALAPGASTSLGWTISAVG
ncbi:aldose 1-epimerase family protein [Agromyces lapidis]|uniref:Aldose 1-epimerase family protein n=1 Tax=Agromyces lapidis TaxID=279574 RepID=A0ABV5SKV3_9MICO|nr:aldose 1-epimerase family protein [Agromyces lapidis]